MYMDSSSDGSTIGESTITSGTSTLPVNNKHLQIDRRTPSVSKFEHTIIYTPNRQYKRIDSSEQYRSYSAPKIYLEDNSNMANIDSIVKCHGNDDCDVDADHSRIRNTLKSYHHHHHHNRHHQQSHRPSDGNYSVRSSYEIELNKYRSCNNNNITDNRIPHSRYNTLSNSFSRRIDNNDALKLYSSVRCHSNPFRGGGDYDHQNTLDSYDSRMNNGLTASPRRPPLLRNLHNHLNLSPWTQEPSIFHSIDSHEKNSLSTRSLCPGIPSQKCVEQTAEIGLYKTAMFVIPSPNSTSLPNVQNIKNTLEETDYNRSLRHKRHRHVHSHSGGHRHHNSHSHHNHRECCDGDDDDAMISKSCNSKLRTYVCSGCGRKTTKRKKVKYLPSSSHSCISLDKCSTPHFISSAFNTSNINNNNNTNSNNNNNNNNTANSRLDIDDVYDSTVFHSSRQFTDDNRYYASPVRKSLSYNKREDIQPTADYISNHSNSNTSLDKIKSYDYLPKCSKSLNTISRADCNKIVVDIKPRQMNEADKQQHITQWIQIGTLGDATSSPTRLPLQTNEYHESDMTGLQQSENSDYDVSIVVDHSNEVNTGWRNSSIVHSRQQDNRHLTEKVVSQQKHSPIPPESPSPSPQPALPRKQHLQQDNHKKDMKSKVEIIKHIANSQLKGVQSQNIGEDDMVRSRNKSSCTNSSINEIKLEFVNNANHIGNNSDEGGYINNNYERSSLISAQPTQLIHMERDLVNGNKYQDNNNNTEKTTSSETLDSNISQSNPIGGANIDIERVITIQSSKVRSNNNNNNNNNINNHKSTDNNLTHFKTSQETVSSTLSHNNNNNNNNNNSNYSDEPDRSISSPPILAPKPKACSTAEKILLKDKKKKKASTLTTSEIRYMNSKISSNLSSVKDISSLFSVGNSNKIEQLNDSTEVATELFPNLIRKRDTPIPNVKNLVSYFSELIKLHTDEEKHCSPSMSNSVNNLSRLKGFDSEMTLNHRHVLREEVEEGEVMRGEDEEEYELDIPTSVSPFLLHHETPTARERRLQAVESLRRRSTLHMKYDLYRVFPPGYSTASSSFLERLGHRVAAENMTDCSNNNNNDNHNINNSNGNICRGLDNDPIRRPLSAPKFQVRMQANLQKDSTAIAAQ